MHNEITIRGARLHNLKNVTLTFPKNKLVVLTGLSGSGKSTPGTGLADPVRRPGADAAPGLVARFWPDRGAVRARHPSRRLISKL